MRSRRESGPRQPVDRKPLPVLVTPRLAAAADAGGLLPLQIAGERLTVRVVGTVRRFPGVDGQAVVGDAEALDGAVNLERPGAARLNEVWLRLRDPARAAAVDRALAAKPFNVLEIESRRALEADARRDPIAHGTLLALAVAAAVALGLALAGILLTVLGDLRDERGELFDLEAQGASPSLLRRIVRTARAHGRCGGARRRRAHRCRAGGGRHRPRRPDGASDCGRAAARARGRRARRARRRGPVRPRRRGAGRSRHQARVLGAGAGRAEALE